MVDCLHSVSSKPDGSPAYGGDGSVEGSAEGEEGDGLEHGSSRLVDAVSLQGDGLVTLQAVTVYPLSHADGGIDEQPGSSTAGDLEAVELRATTEADPSIARQGVDGHAGDCETAEGEDFKHGSFG